MRILISILAMLSLSFSIFGWTSAEAQGSIAKHQRYESAYNFTLSSLSNNSIMILTGSAGVFMDVNVVYDGATAALTTWEMYLTRDLTFSNKAGGFTNVKYNIGYSNEQQSAITNVYDCLDQNFSKLGNPPIPVQTWYKIGSANGANKWTGMTNAGYLIKTVKTVVIGAQYPFALGSQVELAPNTYYFLQVSNSTAAASNIIMNFNAQFTVQR